MKRDKAVETALDVLDATICECGDFNASHRQVGPGNADVAECREPGCKCRTFRPVQFRVERDTR
jgi:hypothetical protein